MSNKILVIKKTYFVDPHGTPDFGGVEKFIADKGDYTTTPDDMYVQHDELVSADDVQASEDAYNMEVYDYTVKELSLEELEAVEEILSEYDAL